MISFLTAFIDIYQKKIFMECEANFVCLINLSMNLKEYDIRKNEISEWIPYLGLMDPLIIENKDNSFMALITYDSNKIRHKEDLNNYLKSIPSGVSIWIEKSSLSLNTICYIVWNPEYDLKDNIKNIPFKIKSNKEPLQLFKEFINIFIKHLQASFLDVDFIKQDDILNKLYQILTLKSSILIPNEPLYLDCYLTQDFKYKKHKNLLKIDNNYLNCIRLLGYPNFFISDILNYIKNSNIKYRYSRRIFFIDKKTTIDIENNYFKRWCTSHKSFLNIFKIKDSACYIENTLVIYNTDLSILNKQVKDLDKYINSKGIASISDNYNIGDVWFGTIPSMFRSGLFPCLFDCKNLSYNLII